MHQDGQIGRVIISPWSAEFDAIKDDEVRILMVPLNNPPLPLAELFDHLTEEEHARADRFRVEKPRVQFVTTRGLLRLTLGKILNLAPINVPIGYSGVGKPYLLNTSDNPHFNVTHTDGLALIALARRVIGVDVERIRHIESMDGLVVRFFSQAEQACYQTLEESKKPAGFFRGWTCKEALIKAVGLSVAYLDTFDVELNPDKPAALLAARNPGLLKTNWSVDAIETVQGYAAAVAVGCG